MKKNFMTGLVILLPLVLTVIVTLFLVNILTKPFAGFISDIVGRHHLQILGSPEVVMFLSKLCILLGLALLLILVGMLARFFLIRFFFHLSDEIVTRIPLINKIYSALRDVTKNVFHEDSQSFSQVVLVPFPKTNTWAIGLVTSGNLPADSDTEHMSRMSVFVPGTPNPTMGFMLLYKREDVIFVDMSVDDALRFVISCGVMYNGFMKDESASQLAR